MDRVWTIVRHTGQSMDLECDGEKKEVLCPKEAVGRDVFMSLQAAQFIDDATLETVLGVKD